MRGYFDLLNNIVKFPCCSYSTATGSSVRRKWTVGCEVCQTEDRQGRSVMYS